MICLHIILEYLCLSNIVLRLEGLLGIVLDETVCSGWPQ